MARLKFPPRCTPTGMPRPAGAKREAAWNRTLRRLQRRPTPSRPLPSPAACAASCPPTLPKWPRKSPRRRTTQGANRGHAAKPASWRWKACTAALPELLGGSADLTGSNLTNTKSTPALRFGRARANVVKTEDGQIGRHINYGVREFGMAAIMNGVALHGGLHPLRRHLHDLQRLQPQRHPHGRADDASASSMCSRTTPSAWAKTAHAPAHRARRQPAPDSGPGRVAPCRHRRNRRGLDAWPWPRRQRPTRLAAEPPKPALPGPRAKPPWTTSRNGAYVLSEPEGVGLRKRRRPSIIATGSEVQLALEAQKLLAAENIARARGLHAQHHHVRPPKREVQASRAARRHCRALPWKWASPMSGGSTA